MLVKRARPVLAVVPVPQAKKTTNRVNQTYREGQEAIRELVWRCAAIQTPTRPTLNDLGAALGCHTTTFAAWVREGRIPKAYLSAIQELYGDELKHPKPYEVDVELLTSKKF